ACDCRPGRHGPVGGLAGTFLWVWACCELGVPMTIFSLLLTSSLGLGAIERGEVEFRPGPQESSVPARFRLEPAVFSYELTPVLSTTHYTVSRLRFPSPVTTADPENNLVHAEYFAPIGR